jgi:hypothetical protein
MKEIFQEYGGIIITVIAIMAVLIVITYIVGTDDKGIVGGAFADLIKSFVKRATMVVSSTQS